MMLSYASYTLQQINKLPAPSANDWSVQQKKRMNTAEKGRGEDCLVQEDWRDEEAWRDPTLNIKTIKKS